MLITTSLRAQSNLALTQELKKLVPSEAPGLHYSFFSVDSVIFDSYLGQADLSRDEKIDEHTTFHYFSNTKTFTTVAILQLQEKGKLSIDDPISTYIEGLPYPKEITIKHLLNHVSGIPNPIPLSWIHLYEDDKTYDHQGFYREIIDGNTKTKFHPNKKYAYSNIEYLILAEIISKVSGSDYRTYMKENVFSKIGNGQQTLGFEIDSHHATGYHNKRSFSNLLLGMFMSKKKFMSGSMGKWKPFNNFQLNGHGYSGVVGTHVAMQMYIQELLNVDSELLTSSSKKTLFQENTLSNGKKSGMCLSWFKGELKEHSYYAHAGGGGGYYSEIRIYPSLGFGSVISFNRSGMKDERILDKFDRHFISQ